jgi:hypothetical protein
MHATAARAPSAHLAQIVPAVVGVAPQAHTHTHKHTHSHAAGSRARSRDAAARTRRCRACACRGVGCATARQSTTMFRRNSSSRPTVCDTPRGGGGCGTRLITHHVLVPAPLTSISAIRVAIASICTTRLAHIVVHIAHAPEPAPACEHTSSHVAPMRS